MKQNQWMLVVWKKFPYLTHCSSENHRFEYLDTTDITFSFKWYPWWFRLYIKYFNIDNIVAIKGWLIESYSGKHILVAL